MQGRLFRLMLLLAATVVIPYVWFHPAVKQSVRDTWMRLSKGAKDALDSDRLAIRADTEPPAASQPGAAVSTARLTGPPATLEELLRFDVSPQWVTQRWSRVSTVLSESDLDGLRVPLVTGTEVTDLAGSLTYYFDQQRRVRRITFHGTTGDDSRLVAFVQTYFGLRSEPALGVGAHMARWNGEVVSVLRVTHAPVVRSRNPHDRLAVSLELNNARIGTTVSRTTQQMLSQHGLTKRW